MYYNNQYRNICFRQSISTACLINFFLKLVLNAIPCFISVTLHNHDEMFFAQFTIIFLNIWLFFRFSFISMDSKLCKVQKTLQSQGV